MKVPLIVATGFICFALGVGGGVATMVLYGYHWNPPETEEGGTPPGMGNAGGPPGGMMGGGGPPGGMMGGGPPGGMTGGGGPPGMGGGRGPSSKNQLTSLVAKLDQLSHKPLTLSLNEEQRTKVREQLQGLAEKEELAEEDAKKRLDALLEIVKGDKETLEAAGYRWPGEGGGFRPPAAVPNPFKEEANANHLKALHEQLTKTKKSDG